MEHRVEPPAWLPEAAAPEGGGPAPGDSTVSLGSAADEASPSNGQDGTAAYEYSYDSSYADDEDSAAADDEEDESLAEEPEAGDGGEQGEETSPVPADFAAPSYYPGFAAEPAYSFEPGPADDAETSPAAAGFAPAGVTGPGTAETDTVDSAPCFADFGAPELSSFGAADPIGPGLSAPGLMASPGLASPGLSGPEAVTSAPASAPAAQETPTYRFTPPSPSKPKQAVPVRRAANLVIARLEPWSVMKFSFLMSLVAWIVLFVAVAILYYALSGLGVFTSIQHTLSNVTSSQGSSGVNLSKWTSAPRVLGYTMLIGAVNVVLITALSTVGAMIYNLVTHLGGGIEVTLRETD